MSNRLNSKKGQILGEYALTFFMVSAAIIAMSVFMARLFQARIFDAKRYMLNTVQNAAPHAGTLRAEYEPYYGGTSSDADRTTSEQKGLEGGGGSGRFYRSLQDTTSVKTNSVQLPPKDAD